MRIDDLPAPLTPKARELAGTLQTGTATLLWYRLGLTDDRIDLIHLFEERGDTRQAGMHHKIGWRFRLTVKFDGFSTVDLIEWAVTRDQKALSHEPASYTETVQSVTAAAMNASLPHGEEIRKRVEVTASKIYVNQFTKGNKMGATTRVQLFMLGGFTSVVNPHERPTFVHSPVQRKEVKQQKLKKGHRRLEQLRLSVVFTPAYVNRFAETRNGSGTRWVDLRVGYDMPHPLEGPSQFRRFRN